MNTESNRGNSKDARYDLISHIFVAPHKTLIRCYYCLTEHTKVQQFVAQNHSLEHLDVIILQNRRLRTW